MKLSRIKAFFDSVDAEWRSPLADLVLSNWAHDPGTCFVLRASSNIVCIFTNAGERCVLRFVMVEERDEAEIQAEMDYLSYLSEQGLRVNRPLPSLAGRLVETVATPLGKVHAVALQHLEGKEKEFDQLGEADFIAWGRALGELHRAAQAFPAASRRSWRDHVQWLNHNLSAGDPDARVALMALFSRLKEMPYNRQTAGLIHYDFESDNLLWQDGAPGMIDFDDSAYYWFAADIAYALRDLFDDRASGVDLAHPSLRAFVSGYRQARPLPDEELSWLPDLMLLHNFMFYAQMSQAQAEPPSQNEPPWIPAIRVRLAGMVQKFRQEIVNSIVK